tara:strand:- start:260 stop:532 length:273 start_codon:yes stop_codon:yes gene_type:complete
MKYLKNYIASIATALTLGCATIPTQTENEKILTARGCNLSKANLDNAERFALLACSLNGDRHICYSAESRYDAAKNIKKESCVKNLFEDK